MGGVDLDALVQACPVCFHPAHEGRCQDADDVGGPWFRPCDCEGPVAGEPGRSPAASNNGDKDFGK